jgi:dihydroorotase
MAERSKILIRGARIIDAANGIDAEGDILIEGGLIAAVGKVDKKASDGAEVVEAKGLVAAPGFVDIHTHLREPGLVGGETVLSGTRAAVNGGYTTVCAMPNTDPAVDSPERVAYQKLIGERAGYARVYPIAAATVGREGERLVEMVACAAEGAVAFSDDGNCIPTAKTAAKVMKYAALTGLPFIEHAEDATLSGSGVMNSGKYSTILGLPGIPASSEEVIIARDCILASETGGRLHIAHVSTAGSVETIECANRRGARVTSEVTPHHLVLDDSALESFHTSFKMKPPLRSADDVQALREALADGVIDCVATDHAPHRIEEKELEFDLAPFGVTGLETAFPLLYTELVETGVLTLARLVKVMTVAPAEILGLNAGTLSPGAPADVALIDLGAEWEVLEDDFASAAINSPFIGWKLRGVVNGTIVGGVFKKRDGQII